MFIILTRIKILGFSLRSAIPLARRRAERQIVIQSNTGTPIISFIPQTTSNGSMFPNSESKPQRPIPTIVMTQGPNNFLSQPVTSLLNFLSNTFSEFVPPSSADKVRLKDVIPFSIIMIPQIPISFSIKDSGTSTLKPFPEILLPEPNALNGAAGNVSQELTHASLLATASGRFPVNHTSVSKSQFAKERKNSEGKLSENSSQATDRIVNYITHLVHQSD